MSIELGNIEVSKTSIEMKVKLFDITGLTITESGKLLYKSRRIKVEGEIFLLAAKVERACKSQIKLRV